MIFNIIWLLVILFLSIIPTRGPQTNLPLDKIIHFVVYGITAVIFFRDLRSRVSFNKAIAFSIIFASSYGLAMEILQSSMPWREFSFLDEVANISGAASIVIIYAAMNYRKKKQAK
jgi:VanZ family protein